MGENEKKRKGKERKGKEEKKRSSSGKWQNKCSYDGRWQKWWRSKKVFSWVDTARDNIFKQMRACVRKMVEQGGVVGGCCQFVWRGWSTGVIRKGVDRISSGSEFDGLQSGIW